jgi:hypothetical protein
VVGLNTGAGTASHGVIGHSSCPRRGGTLSLEQYLYISTSTVLMNSISLMPRMIMVITRVEMCKWRVTGAMVYGLIVGGQYPHLVFIL